MLSSCFLRDSGLPYVSFCFVLDGCIRQRRDKKLEKSDLDKTTSSSMYVGSNRERERGRSRRFELVESENLYLPLGRVTRYVPAYGVNLLFLGDMNLLELTWLFLFVDLSRWGWPEGRLTTLSMLFKGPKLRRMTSMLEVVLSGHLTILIRSLQIDWAVGETSGEDRIHFLEGFAGVTERTALSYRNSDSEIRLFNIEEDTFCH